MANILIVESDQELLGKLAEILEPAGFQYQSCSSVGEALSLNLDQFDAIICNLRLPNAPGTDLIQHTSTPILICSNFASLRTAIDTSKNGAMEYLSIPFVSEEVLAHLKKVITNRK